MRLGRLGAHPSSPLCPRNTPLSPPMLQRPRSPLMACDTSRRGECGGSSDDGLRGMATDNSSSHFLPPLIFLWLLCPCSVSWVVVVACVWFLSFFQTHCFQKAFLTCRSQAKCYGGPDPPGVGAPWALGQGTPAPSPEGLDKAHFRSVFGT